MSDLVVLKGSNLFTTSRIFAEQFSFLHSNVIQKIEKLALEYSIVRNQFKLVDFVNSRNQTFQEYEISKDGFMTLVFQMGGGKSKKSRDLVMEKQQLFIKAFNAMEQMLLRKDNQEYLVARNQGKVARREATDAVKILLDYIASNFPESSYNSNPDRAYSNYSNATNKALSILTQSKAGTREILDVLELNQLYLAEHIVSSVILQEVEAKEHYKVIFEKCKVALEKFADSLMLDKKTHCQIFGSEKSVFLKV